MKKHLTQLLLALIAGASLLTARAAELEWHTDLAKAQAKAKAEKKMVMLDFTGSDWCGWCIKLNKEVFSTDEFAEYAKKNLVLVEVDFPRKKEMSAEQKKANQALQTKYKIQGYPTLIVLDGEGKQVGQLGYVKGGPKAWIEEFEKQTKSKS
jgi:protein disulfide-isomerase